MIENHKIVLSTDFIKDYSKSNTGSYKKGTDSEVAPPEPDEDKLSSCSKLEDSLSDCIRNYYVNYLEGERETDQNDRSTELLKCAGHLREYESCVKKL